MFTSICNLPSEISNSVGFRTLFSWLAINPTQIQIFAGRLDVEVGMRRKSAVREVVSRLIRQQRLLAASDRPVGRLVAVLLGVFLARMLHRLADWDLGYLLFHVDWRETRVSSPAAAICLVASERLRSTKIRKPR